MDGASLVAVISIGMLGIMLYRQVGDHQRPAVHADKAEKIQEARVPPTVEPEATADVSEARTGTETAQVIVSTPESKTTTGSKQQVIKEPKRKERPVVPPPITEKATLGSVKEIETPKQPEVVKKPTEQPVPTESENQVASINKPIPLERRLIGLAISPTQTSINVKDKVSLTVKGKYSDGRDEIVAGVRWQSSNENIAEVNSKGVLEGKNEGKVEITASYAGVSTVYTVYIKGVEVEKPKDSGTEMRDIQRRILR